MLTAARTMAIDFQPAPVIPPVPQDGPPRPFWSVMIPAYNPPAGYLEETLRSVLVQDPGPEQMQIEVVDDCSPQVDVAALVHKIAGDRVKVSRTPGNQGLAGCWNMALARSRGEWVHLLHQDDLVMPGFYEALRKGAAADENVGVAFCRHIFVNADGHWLFLSAIEQPHAGLMARAPELLAEYPRIQTPSIVVRREAYVTLGGFNDAYCYALDWEMWCRIAARYLVWYEPRPLAIYRSHAGSESSRLARGGEDVWDSLRCVEINTSRLPPASARQVRKTARTYLALLALDNAWGMATCRNFSAAWALACRAFSCSCALPVINKFAGLVWKGLGTVVRRAVRVKFFPRKPRPDCR